MIHEIHKNPHQQDLLVTRAPSPVQNFKNVSVRVIQRADSAGKEATC